MISAVHAEMRKHIPCRWAARDTCPRRCLILNGGDALYRQAFPRLDRWRMSCPRTRLAFDNARV
jgi:hypothetical protein